jgi:acyl-coenzyme A synthetase/AMP-(fatty) acid ligase
MITFNQWLAGKAEEFSSNIYLIDSSTQITYAKNFITIKMLMHKLQEHIQSGQYVIFLGTSSIASYQLYFATIALQAIWVPVIWQAKPETLNSVIQQLNKPLVIYDTLDLETLEKLKTTKLRCLELRKIFASLKEEELFYPLAEKNEDRIISAYLTSGSTAAAKLVAHTAIWVEYTNSV